MALVVIFEVSVDERMVHSDKNDWDVARMGLAILVHDTSWELTRLAAMG